MKRFAVLFLCALPGIAAGQADAEINEREARLQILRAQIGVISEQLAEARERAGGLEAELADLEQRINQQRQGLQRLDTGIRERSTAIANLEASVTQKAEQTAQHRAFIAASVRAAHRRGQADSLRLLLGDADASRAQRLLVYQQRIARVRATRIRDAQIAITEYQNERRALQAALDEQQASRAQRQMALGQLQSTLGEREALLARVEAAIEQDDARLSSRQQEAETLEQLIADVQDRLASAPARRSDAQAIDTQRGRLGWPLRGPLLASYGAERAAGLRWTGLLIGGDSGAPVHPVAAGQVVFSDWLRGLGLLLIIDHGDGYLSLYGRNQALYFDVGDWVEPRHTIATVGRSGGRPETALYFELRADGQPINPLAWLQGSANQG